MEGIASWFNRLIADLNFALYIGEIAEAEIEEDSGRPNYDGFCLESSVIDEDKFKVICERLKIGFKKKTIDGETYYLVYPRTTSKGAKRRANAEAACTCMIALGYDAYDYVAGK